jgi:GH25 family lysozyme M1 (1,4-beta-N-acetylmuramidase)
VTLDPLFVDLYVGDGRKDYRAFCAAGYPWTGVIWKASQGARYRYDDYVATERKNFLAAAGDRYGVDAFDGFYDFLDLAKPGAEQADFFLRAVESVGGEKLGTLWGMVDVERGGQSVKNPSKAQVEDRTREWVERYLQLTGRYPTVYGGELLRSVGVTDRLGAGRSALAVYDDHMVATLVTKTGTDLAHLLLWQYRGTDLQKVGPSGYPMTAPGCGVVDICAMVLPGGLDAMRSGLWAEAPAN